MGFHLPAVYAQLLSSDMGTLFVSPDDIALDCASCGNHDLGMTCKARLGSRSAEGAQEGKCCYYRPFLPNYLVGGILKSLAGQAVRQIERMIRDREWALPIGLCPPPQFVVEYRRGEMGNLSGLRNHLCPFFDPMLRACSIWDFRDAICAAYFCNYEGSDEKAWLDWRDRLFLLQSELAAEALLRLGWLPDEFSGLWPAADGRAVEDLGVSSEIAPEAYRRIWREYAGRQSEFYQLCYERLAARDQPS